jgi:hypothetical protein
MSRTPAFDFVVDVYRQKVGFSKLAILAGAVLPIIFLLPSDVLGALAVGDMSLHVLTAISSLFLAIMVLSIVRSLFRLEFLPITAPVLHVVEPLILDLLFLRLRGRPTPQSSTYSVAIEVRAYSARAIHSTS